MPADPTPDELDAVVRFVAAQQARTDRRITYVGTEAAGIRAELDGLDPPWAGTVRVERERGAGGDDVVGAVLVEWDRDLGRSWVVGPWVAADDADAWAVAAGRLLDAALAQVPPGVTRHELAGDAAHVRLAALAAARGWSAGEANHILVVDAAVVDAWPWPDGGDTDGGAGIREATTADVAPIAALHDVEFPDTYASAARLVAGQLDGTRVTLVATVGADHVAGYAAGEVHDDGEGFVDFVVVDPADRGRGVGRRLVVALTRQLVAQAPLGRVALTVQDHRAPARALYQGLGFRSDGTLVGYRSWDADARRE